MDDDYDLQDARSIQYAWREWENLERLTGFKEIRERLMKDYPHVFRAWEEYKYHKLVLTTLIEQMET